MATPTRPEQRPDARFEQGFEQAGKSPGEKPCESRVPISCYSQRIAYSVKVFRITLRLAGVILLLVQIIKAGLEVSNGEGFSLSVVATMTIAIVLIVVSLPPFLESAIAQFAERSRRESFGKYIYLIPFWLSAVFITIKLLVGPTSDSWRYMGSEGGLSEYGTALIYLLMPVFTYPMAKAFGAWGRKLMATLYYLLSAAAFFVGMEELSWGQKLLGFEEPQFWSEHNVQSELTIHNLSFFQNILHISFLIVGLIGSLCWIGLHYWQKQNRKTQNESSQLAPQETTLRRLDLSYLLPDWPISSFFYPIVVFYILFDYTDFKDRVNFLHSSDEEHCELIMSMGILLFVIIRFFHQGKARDLTRQGLL